MFWSGSTSATTDFVAFTTPHTAFPGTGAFQGHFKRRSSGNYARVVSITAGLKMSKPYRSLTVAARLADY